MNKPIQSLLSIISLFLLLGCGAYFNQPVVKQSARQGELTTKSKTLTNLPLPADPVVVGVYNFKDQTGQYKNIEAGSSFSTAVSQGATTILIKALEDSKWFTPIERENLNNLLNERSIIRATRDEYRKSGSPNEPNLPPLLFAGVLLEGGIISYDSNIITGGAGARYFGVGGSTQYREDRISVYLRAVSTSSGKILKTVYVSKTILSQAVSANLFKYVNFQRLLEVETGFTVNEPVQLAMKDAIEKSVEALIIEGIQDGLWSTKAGKSLNDSLVANYVTEKELEQSMLLYDRVQNEKEAKNSLTISGGLNLLDGDYGSNEFSYLAKLGYTRDFSNSFSILINASFFENKASDIFTNQMFGFDANLEYKILPKDNFSPFIYGGFGLIYEIDSTLDPQSLNPELISDNEGPYFKVQYGLALEHQISERLSLRGFAEHNLAFSDELDKVINGKRDDHFFNFGIGLKYFFGFNQNKKTTEIPEE